MVKENDAVERRIVVEFGRRYAYLYLTDRDGKVIDEDLFTQPYLLERKEAFEEAKEAYHFIYDYLNDSINFPTAGIDEDGGTPEA